MIEKGIVGKIFDDGRCEVLIDGAACGNCHEKGGCGMNHHKIKLIVLNDLHAQIGDKVTVSLSEGRRMALAFLFFLVPVLFLVLGYTLGNSLAERLNNGWWTAVTIVLSLSVSFLLIWLISRFLQKKADYIPRIIAVNGPGGIGCELP